MQCDWQKWNKLIRFMHRCELKLKLKLTFSFHFEHSFIVFLTLSFAVPWISVSSGCWCCCSCCCFSKCVLFYWNICASYFRAFVFAFTIFGMVSVVSCKIIHCHKCFQVINVNRYRFTLARNKKNELISSSQNAFRVILKS